MAFAAFGVDKQRARTGARRIRERTLLALAFAGGAAGATAGQQLFRHKTRKQPFATLLLLAWLSYLPLMLTLTG